MEGAISGLVDHCDKLELLLQVKWKPAEFWVRE